MLQIPILDAIIAVVFVFFLFSLLATLIVETLNQIRNTRGKYLFYALQQVFGDSVNRIYNSPAINTLGTPPTQGTALPTSVPAQPKEAPHHAPAYISAESFCMVVLDFVIEQGRTVAQQQSTASNTPPITDNFELFKMGVTSLTTDSAVGKELKKWLTTFLNNSPDLQALQTNIRNWYNEYMNRLGSWYKAITSKLLLIVAIPIVVIFNVDAIRITQSVMHDPALRENLVKMAVQSAQPNSKYEPVKDLPKKGQDAKSDSLTQAQAIADVQSKISLAQNAYQDIKSQNLPIGWTVHWKDIVHNLNHPNFWWIILSTLAGWVISIFAIQRGAPFWYDLLGSLVNMRSAGKKPNA